MLCPSLCERRIFEHPPAGRAAEAGERRAAPAAAQRRPAPSRGRFGFRRSRWGSDGFSAASRVPSAASRCAFRGRATTATGPAGCRTGRRGGASIALIPPKLNLSPADPRLPQPCPNFFPKYINFSQPDFGSAARHCGILPLPGRTRYAWGWLPWLIIREIV